MFSTAVIALLGVLLLIGTVVPGMRLWWPRHGDLVSRSDLGIALMTGAVIAFSVFALQLVIQIRSQRDADARERQADKQALLLLLGRSSDLSGVDLREKDLSHAYLNEKVLRGGILEKATLTEVQLQDADLLGANLRRARLELAHLDRADLRFADFAGATLEGATLTGANLDAATLSPLREGNRLVGVNLNGADLSNASARGADLHRANLTEARLIGTRLAPANLQGANLQDADLEFADLRGANLKGADLSGANLDSIKDLSFAKFDRTTTWPEGFKWPTPPDKGGAKPFCPEGTCTLSKKRNVGDLPPRLNRMLERLATAAGTPRCLPGWRIEQDPYVVLANWRDPRGIARARFLVNLYDDVAGETARAWAQSLHAGVGVRPIASIRADGAATTYAAHYDQYRKGQVRAIVAVWSVRGRYGFYFEGSASPALFPLFQRDFVKIFRVLGVHGEFFPALRGETNECRT